MVILAVLAVVTVVTTSALRTAVAGRAADRRRRAALVVGGALPRHRGRDGQRDPRPARARRSSWHSTSDDVIHSFWVPQLAGKIDLIPGSTNHLALHRRHRRHVTRASAPSSAASSTPTWASWSSSTGPPTSVAGSTRARAGAAGTRRPKRPPPVSSSSSAQACAGCHTVRGTERAGHRRPDLTDVGSRRTPGRRARCRTRRATSRAWIRDAQAFKPGNSMPSFGPLSTTTLHALVAYLESLQ